ncbi:MAG: gliding motility lipoprotein GldH, partial [Pedobacter sp.]|nr:gliding motility lipoprotein GldH [Pedobacter sp.]
MFILLLSGCANNKLADVNMELPENNWTYGKSVIAIVEIKDPSLVYNLSFKMRNTADYRYSNIYVVVRIKGNSLSKNTRYQFQLAKADGEWL